MARGRRKKGVPRGNAAGASTSRSREEQQKLDEAAMEEAVTAELRKAVEQERNLSGFELKLSQAMREACVRSFLMWMKQDSIKTLPKFEIDINCTPAEMDIFFEERRFRFQLIASFFLVNGIVATPPRTHITYQLVEAMEKYQDENGKTQKRSVMQFIVNEYDGYFSGFRPTPPGDKRYQPGGFFIFQNLQYELPKFFGTNFIMGHKEDYDDTTLVQLRPGFLEWTVEKLGENFTAENYMDCIDDRQPYLEAFMVFLGECQRSFVVQEDVRGTEDGPFGAITGPLDRSENAIVSYVTAVLDVLFHSWSALSKTGLWLLIAILELGMGLQKDALISFIKGRNRLRRCIRTMAKSGKATVDLQVFDAARIFRLKYLLGRYLLLVKYEEEAVIRCVMRERIGFKATYDRCGSSEENIRLQHLWDTCADDSDDETTDFQRPYLGDKREWNRWLSIRDEPRNVPLVKRFME